ncbi:hypothetical protein GJ744_006078 [Endocarpon pusillum]|uniref:Uncharacterized protein n=1 Tax=Endocarpon pusillum TaxID=364733 RepID=A0A8H7APN7_9EURO|nr:hypothetical protein GJ744_006078 [Endocarpon pusillum]
MKRTYPSLKLPMNGSQGDRNNLRRRFASARKVVHLFKHAFKIQSRSFVIHHAQKNFGSIHRIRDELLVIKWLHRRPAPANLYRSGMICVSPSDTCNTANLFSNDRLNQLRVHGPG